MTTQRMATCHPDRPYRAKGLCNSCYVAKWLQEHPGRKMAQRKPATCHPELPSVARGLCNNCYMRYRRQDPEAGKKMRASARRRYHEKYKLDPEFTAQQLYSRYGLTADQHAAMLTEQGGVCAVCRNPPSGKRPLHVDHDHDTGKVRALLCQGCNSALGMVKDDRSRLIGLVAYLDRFSS